MSTGSAAPVEGHAAVQQELPLAKLFGRTAFRHPFRRYQRLALDAFEQERRAGSHSIYLVLPPGAGKTALGLEIGRRLERRMLVLCPNTAVQGQWLRQWEAFEPATVEAGADASLTNPLTVLTYQTLCSLDFSSEHVEAQALALWRSTLEEEGLPAEEALRRIARLRRAENGRYREELGSYRRRVRRLVARGGNRQELLDLLHPNGRALVARAQTRGPLTLVLDECHHLLEMWGYLVRALIEELGADTFVVGLTATPPDLLTGEQRSLYDSLFGHADFQVPTPAVVKEGDLAPYQELAYLVRPLEPEARFVAEQHERFTALLSQLLDPDFASRSFVEWLRQRVVERTTASGAVVSWGALEREDPAFAQAALRFFMQYRLDLPPDVHLGERHRQPLEADDWVTLLERYCLEVLKVSPEPRDAAAWDAIRHVLPSLGYVLTNNGVRAHRSPVDRVLALSAAKGVAVTEILRAEHAVMGNHLRALVLCDYERTSARPPAQLRGVLDQQAGSARLLIETLLADAGSASLRPLLLTARTVACSRATLVHLGEWLYAQEAALAAQLDWTTPRSNATIGRTGRWDDLVVISADTGMWRPRVYVPLLTRAFEAGVVQCLVGTRGLLGEGWDATRVNVLVDLTTVGTSTAVHQMRGRSLRLDPHLPRKVADNWDVVCIDPEHPKGAADYRRFVRKHERYFAPTREGAIESGVSHVHHDLSPYGPPPAAAFASINTALLERARERESAYARWRIGEPYFGVETATVRLRFGRSPGLPPARMTRRGQELIPELPPPPYRRRWWWLWTLAAAGLAAQVGPGATALVLGGLLALSAWWLEEQRASAREAERRAWRPPTATDTLEAFGAALIMALRTTGQLRPEVGTADVRAVLEDDGYYRCFLANASAEESARFVEALDEMLGPLEEPRYLIPREVQGLDGRSIADQGRFGAGLPVVYHAVPTCLSRNKRQVRAFQAAWNRYVSPGAALRADEPLAEGVLAAYRGESPFAVTSQLRTLWT